MSRYSGDFDGHPFATNGTNGQFFDCAAIKVEGSIHLPDFGDVQVACTFQPYLFLNQKADDRRWKILVSLFQSFNDGRQDCSTTSPVVCSQTRWGTAVHLFAFDYGLTAHADRHSIHVSRQQCSWAIAVSGKGDDQIATVSVKPRAFFCSIKFDL